MKELNITYPFQFKELLITDKLLDVLGFTEYWAGIGDFGSRNLDLGGVVGDDRLLSKNEFPNYQIFQIDESDDPEAGYGLGKPEYSSEHFTNKEFERMYFLHEMYEDILKRRTPEEIVEFEEITKKHGVNMYPYIQSWLSYKQSLTSKIIE